MGISLSKFDTKTKANEGVEVELLDVKTGEGSGAFITVRGTDSEAFRLTSAELARSNLGRVPTIADMEVDAATLLAACTVATRNLDNADGSPVEVKDIKQIYIDHPAIREQIDVAVGKRTAFLKA